MFRIYFHFKKGFYKKVGNKKTASRVRSRSEYDGILNTIIASSTHTLVNLATTNLYLNLISSLFCKYRE